MTAAGLRYVLYAYATSFEDPSVVIAEPGGLLLGPRGEERVGDVSNVVFSNGAILEENGRILLYYASSDTRVHVAETSLERLEDYIFHTPQDPGRSPVHNRHYRRKHRIDPRNAPLSPQDPKSLFPFRTSPDPADPDRRVHPAAFRNGIHRLYVGL